MYNLTKGALDEIMNGVDIKKPVLQILGYKKIPSSINTDDRYRLLLSDGDRLNSFTMLVTHLNHLITNNSLTQYTVCKILNYALTSVNNNGKERRIMLILDIEVLFPGNEVGYKIGNPTNTDNKSRLEYVTTSNTSTATSCQTSNSTIEKNILNHDTSSTSFYINHSISTIPIAILSPYQNRWIIKARVTNKSAIKTWSNSRGEGKLFSMDLIDESGEIRCVAFNQQCDNFYHLIDVGNVYYISRCKLKTANKQFSTLKNDYEMTITDDTMISPCHKNCDNIPMQQFDFCPISQVESKEQNNLIDVLGVVTTFNDIQHITQRTTGKELIKRDINLIDDSGAMICVALWGKEAEDFDGFNNPILAIKGARVGEFNGGKNLSLINSSVLKKDPDIPEAHKLRKWYAAANHLENVKFLSRSSGGDFNTPLYTFREMTEAQLGGKLNFTDLYKVVATINLIRVENSVYKACPIDSCRKKLIDQSTGIFRCEKCNKDYPNFVYRLLANMNIADATGNRWVIAFNEVAEKILGISAQELGELKENDNDDYMEKLNEANFKRFIFSLRVKSEVFQDEMRIKHTCTSVVPLNYKTHLTYLIDEVSKVVHIEKLESN
ncbi:Replication protein A 70 kDa DNA-binding subunit [Camponotus floridanus]|uniref:Replication protein A subunit n=2 Tax=Camponotus floridanus TaxID=104421 RepID=E2A770_CAMFO|nr:replication protein A 70 kDa DNA-binding subunit isoform X1 [Camponotus floridanus]EFN70726.1 Replication protein A 70 kDa DNA-binding subunit [Camponotus floridanus]